MLSSSELATARRQDMTAQTGTISLTELGNVPSSYRHEWRVAESLEAIVLPHTIFKWYHVRREGVPVTAELDAEAQSLLIEAATGGAWTPEYGLNFAMLHVSTAHAFLIAGVWRGHQELWQRAYAKDLAADGSFTRVDLAGEDAPFQCVWEMGVTCHERMAWHRYLLSGRAEADKRAWLADTYTGRV
jgi:hypothetical protein